VNESLARQQQRPGAVLPAKRVGCIALFDIPFVHVAFANHGR
jgi:hypothetical protein